MRSLDGFLLAAGLGTRMGPLSKALPKPAWTLNGRSLLQHGARSMRAAGLSSLACNVHLHPEKLRVVAEGLEVFEEPSLLGSAGGLVHARDRVERDLAVWNADAFGEPDWAGFREAHRASRADLSWLLLPHPGGAWTRVWLDGEGRVLPPGETGEGPYLFCGAAMWSRSALALLPEGPSEVRDLLPRLGRHLGVVMDFPWWEVGTPDALIAAAGALAPEAEGRLASCYIHPSARPAGRLHRCVLGPGAAPHPALEDRGALWFEEDGRQVRLSLPPLRA